MEVNNDINAWKEVRSRIDSLASGIFFISGAALTLSMFVFLNLKAANTPVLLNIDIQYIVESAWYCLLGTILFFALLKAHLILQCFHMKTAVECPSSDKNNLIALLIGLIGLTFFLFGMVLLVKAAALTLYA